MMDDILLKLYTQATLDQRLLLILSIVSYIGVHPHTISSIQRATDPLPHGSVVYHHTRAGPLLLTLCLLFHQTHNVSIANSDCKT